VFRSGTAAIDSVIAGVRLLHATARDRAREGVAFRVRFV
jgi:hypothetical protein